MAAARPGLGRVIPGSSILFLCDMQEKFRHVLFFPQIVSVAARMLKVQPLPPQTPQSRAPAPPPSDPPVQGPGPSSLRPRSWAPSPFLGLRPLLLTPTQVARLLDVPVVLTEQYPQGLGPTVPELGAEGLQPRAKTCFSMVPVVQQELDARPRLRSVLLCGLEAQACILVRPQLNLGDLHSHLGPPQPKKGVFPDQNSLSSPS